METFKISLICALLAFLESFDTVSSLTQTLFSTQQHQRHKRQLYLTEQQPRIVYQNSTSTERQNQRSPDYGPWGPWTESSDCSRTCGGGIAYQERICMNVRLDGRHTCVGSARRYFSCNTEECPRPARDFRGEQCARFNSMPYEGKYYSWLPYYSAQAPCELHCKPYGGGFIARLDRRVIDGTRCRDDGSLDVCVDAQCLPVGCDGVLGSTTQEDECRVCGGNGSTCNIVKGVLEEDSFEVGYNDILLIPVGATSILIKEVEPTNNYLAIRNTNGTFYLNGNWRIEFPRELRIAGTIFHYERKQRGYDQPETLRARGPTIEPIFVVLLYQAKNLGISYEYSVPRTTRTQLPDSYSWTTGDFEECSQTCGGGVQYRPVRCIRNSDRETAEEEVCDLSIKPPVEKSCNPQPCPQGWQIGDWSECSQSCGGGTQYRLVYCHLSKDGRPVVLPDETCEGSKPLFMRACNDEKECPDWTTGEWSECDRMCGPGNQTRTVECKAQEDGEDVPTCDDDKMPSGVQNCNLGPCEGVEWILSDWSGCDGSCSPHIESREAHCANEKGVVFPNDACQSSKLPELTRSCPKSAMCEPMWHTSQWTDCSVECGNGVQSRLVFCGVWQDDSLMKIAAEKCDPTKKFESVQNCTSEPCAGVWFTGPWNRCSVPCGGGERTRKILCFHEDMVVDRDQCDSKEEPFSKESCNMTPCDDDEVMEIGGCKDSDFGCCPDGITKAGPNDEECPRTDIVSANTTCKEAEFGCCDDNFTLALGPFRKGCLPSSDCNSTKHGCCPDNITSADGPDFEGCSTETVSCDETLFGCCPDNVTDASGFDFEGCSNETISCNETLFGCCPDNVTAASGFDFEGCDIPCENTTFGCCPDDLAAAAGFDFEGCDNGTTTVFPPDMEGSGEDDCYTMRFGCCPDGITAAVGLDQYGCEDKLNVTDCKTSAFGCCSDENTFAEGPSKSGCPEMEGSGEDELLLPCEETMFGCCPDNITLAKGFENEGCFQEDCSNTTFGCCPDNITIANGPSEEGCFPDDCSNTTFGCCPDNITIADGPNEGGCFPEDCTNTTFGCCPDNITIANGPNEEGCFPEDCTNATFGCCPDNITIANGPNEEGCFPEDCSNTTFGCCSDNITIAIGPNEEGCFPEDCSNSTFGCCPDNVTLATGLNGEGCFPENCSDSTFGCCPDNITIAIGSDYQGCVYEDCANTTYGCCPDNMTVSGPLMEGCDVISINCSDALFGCCPDNVTEATGPAFFGCENITDCELSEFGCCEDNVTFATGFENEGCNATDTTSDIPETTTLAPMCISGAFGCCPDEITVALGPNLEGCCFGMRFGCCPDNKTAALGPTFLGCGCQTFPYGCCPDGINPAQGFNYYGCRCEHFRYGCCQDNFTPATGPNFEGCVCNQMQYGCCPDGRTPIINDKGDGCGCEATRFRCCPDGRTPAKGPNLSGCPCDTLVYGCCPDGYTPARTEDLRECPCESQRYGCCLDGRTVARGPNYEGCPCESTRFGCCPDARTAAQGPDMYGCPCDSMRYGCCADGHTSAQGPRFEGCPDVKRPKPKVSTEVCSLDKDSGPCRNFSVMWYFDVSYGSCSRFWYGGCDGNGNQFATVEECENSCVNPDGPEACFLPKTVGSCNDKIPSWYYDVGSESCEAFTYGGCLGNNNRFVTKEACEQKCTSLQPPAQVDVCSLPKDEGSCDNLAIHWYYNKDNSRCEQFYYGGCKGNANRFDSRRDCEKSCLATVVQEPDACRQPQKLGSCTDFRERWWFDYGKGECHRFMYSGCNGNENNFGSLAECQQRCSPSTATDEPSDLVFKTEHCFLSQEPGPCSQAEVNWYYDSSDGVCKEFYYGGCKGNLNRFKTRKECETACFKAQDVCSLSVVKGSCSGEFTQWYYNTDEGDCLEFIFTGCQGNANRFNNKEDCYQRCRKDKLTTVAPAIVPDDVCNLPQEPGPCLGYYRMWYYDNSDNICRSFVYGGCEGNNNRFEQRSECEGRCVKKVTKVTDNTPVKPQLPKITNEDVCRLPVEAGPCSEAHPRWFYDAQTQSCLPFVFGGCGGNKNKFKTSEMCLRFCTGIRASVSPLDDRFKPLTTTTTLQPTQCPPSKCADIQCPYGIEESFDDNGCSSCRCSNPCEVHECPDGSRCAIDVVRTSRVGIRTEPVCRRVNKPGQCPPTTRFTSNLRDCETRCRDDADCRGEHKCCNNGCAMQCVPPEEPSVAATAPEPAEILPGPNVTKGYVGQPAELSCNAIGWPRPTVTWWRQTTMLPLSSQRYEQMPNFALLIRSVVHEDGGDYSCHAYNGIGSGAKIKVTLIIDLSPYPLQHGADENIRDSEPFGGERTQPPQLPFDHSNGQMPHLQSNVGNQQQPQPFDPVPVHIETQVSLVTSDPKEGSPLQIDCSVKGPNSGMKISWSQGNQVIEEDDRRRLLSNHTLLITKAEVGDSGEYKCIAEYEANTSSSSVAVTVNAAPEDTSCVDNPQFSNCELIVQTNYCNNRFYGKFCCASCLKAGQLQSFPTE